MQNSPKSGAFLPLVYREFSRQKFNKYRLRFPRLRDAEITRMVMGEWEKLDEAECCNLFDQYRRKGLIVLQPVDDVYLDAFEEKLPRIKLSDVMQEPKIKGGVKRDPTMSTALQKNQKQKIKDPQIKGFAKAEQSRNSQATHHIEDSSEELKVGPQEQRSEWSSRGSQIVQQKSIKKTKVNIDNLRNSEYIKFYRFYSERLAKEHPRWSGVQRTVIIKLLWKKRQISKKKQRLNKHKSIKKASFATKEQINNRPMSAYDMFVNKRIEENPTRKVKDVRCQSFMVWKKFHLAGKNYFMKLAAAHNKKLSPKEQPVYKVEKSCAKVEENTGPRTILEFMNCPIDLTKIYD